MEFVRQSIAATKWLLMDDIINGDLLNSNHAIL